MAELPQGCNELVTIVVPAFNEEAVIDEFYDRTIKAVDQLDCSFQILFINDGSSDLTLEKISALRLKDSRVHLIDLSRNFGKEIALTAGLDHAVGDAVVVIDADLQDPPELIGELIKKWREGFDVVYAQRTGRDGESWLKKLTAFLFYRVIRSMGDRVEVPTDVGDFRLIARPALDALKEVREQHRFMKGLFSWVGFKQTAVPYRREARYAGETKWNYWKLWNFSLEGITSFSIAPLKIASYFGLFISFSAFLFAMVVVVRTLIYGDPVAGYPSLMAVVLFLGGVQLFFIGIVGEYLGRVFNETKRRPLYFIRQKLMDVEREDVRRLPQGVEPFNSKQAS